jgi:hypothetical protein
VFVIEFMVFLFESISGFVHLLWPILWSLERYYIQHFLGLVEILLCLLLPPNKHCYDGGGGGFHNNPKDLCRRRIWQRCWRLNERMQILSLPLHLLYKTVN